MTTPDQTFQNAVTLFNTGQIDDAEKSCLSVLSDIPDHPGALDLLGVLHHTAARYEDAMACFQQAIAAQPKQAASFFHMGVTLKTLGREHEAHQYYQTACDLKPDNAIFLTNLGACKEVLQNFEGASDAYKCALTIAPDNVYARINLISVLEKQNHLNDAQDVLTQTPETQQSDPSLAVLEARLKRRNRQYESAMESLNRCDAPDLLPKPQDYYFELARLQDGLEQYDAAFKAIEKANQFWLKSAGKLDPEAIFQDCRTYTELFQPQHIRTWSPPAPSSARKPPVFIVGFPRSGTTLIDRILLSAPGTTLLEERPVMDFVINVMRQNPTLQNPATLTKAQIEDLQSLYFDTASQYLAADEQQKTILDKIPLNMISLGLIHRIFPDAKIIVMRRHPLDCLLSCLMQNFTINKGTLPLTDINNAARLYDTAHKLLRLYRNVLPDMSVFDVQYEELVTSPQSVTQNLFSFLGLDWSEDVLDFYKQKQGPTVTTASYHQVQQPLYKSSVGRWHKYKEHLEPAMRYLQPYINA